MQIRNLVWDIIINHHIKSLPVDIVALAKSYCINVYTYEQNKAMLTDCGLYETALQNDAISIYTDCWNIFYNPSPAPENRYIYAVAHELGHILLKHSSKSVKVGHFTAYYTDFNRDEKTNNGEENDANSFASRLLAPAIVLSRINCVEVADIMQLCGLSQLQAAERSGRIKKLIDKNSFFKHRLETKVFEQFADFVNNYRK